MAVIEIKAEPSRKDLVVFAVLWLVGLPALGLVLPRMGDGLLVVAGAATACLVLSLVLNADQPRRVQLAGLALPVVLAAIWGASSLGGPLVPGVILAAFSVVGVVGGVATLLSRPIGTRLYHGWMLGVLPIGWTVSHVLLSIVFFGVVTPIGLALRLLGRDPLDRRFDAGASTYWRTREATPDARRYMRQF